MHVGIVNYVWAEQPPDPARLLEHYFTLTGWADAIRAAGIERVTVFQRYRRHATLERAGIRYVFCDDSGAPTPSAWRDRCRCVQEAVVETAPDLVHVNSATFPRQTARLRRALPRTTAVVVQDHGGLDPLAAPRLKRAWVRTGLAAADALLVSSEGQAVEWRRSGIAPADLSIFHVMECGTTVAPLATRRADLPVRLLWVGRLNANKDPLTVLRGVEPFLASHPGATLTMVYAENDLEREVRQRIDGSDVLRCRVTLLGRVERSAMPGHFSDADIFVLGSHREGSGYALIEALACGVMPVVSDIPSFRALTNDGREGELWRPGDAMAFTQALTRAVHRLTEDDRARRRAFFDRHFSWRAIGERAVRIYEEVVAGRRSSTRRR